MVGWLFVERWLEHSRRVVAAEDVPRYRVKSMSFTIQDLPATSRCTDFTAAMNNVWTSIALRAPCAARQTRAKPVLELFNGYARRYQSQWLRDGESKHRNLAKQRATETPCVLRQAFSTTSLLCAQRRPPPPPRERPPPPPREPMNTPHAEADPSGLEPAPTVASHTEGLSEDKFTEE